jgi:Tfp pilus assembly ATPase PilU
MQTMDASLAQLLRADKITRELAFSRAHSPEELRRLVGTSGTTGQLAA